MFAHVAPKIYIYIPIVLLNVKAWYRIGAMSFPGRDNRAYDLKRSTCLYCIQMPYNCPGNLLAAIPQCAYNGKAAFTVIARLGERTSRPSFYPRKYVKFGNVRFVTNGYRKSWSIAPMVRCWSDQGVWVCLILYIGWGEIKKNKTICGKRYLLV